MYCGGTKRTSQPESLVLEGAMVEETLEDENESEVKPWVELGGGLPGCSGGQGKRKGT